MQFSGNSIERVKSQYIHLYNFLLNLYFKIEYVETTGEKMCKVTCPSYVSYGDYDCHNTIIKVHSEILSDDWKAFLEELFRRKMVDGIKKQITAIENVISTGPSQIEKLKKELEKLENERCANFGNVSTV